jgi:hypothetical protein
MAITPGIPIPSAMPRVSLERPFNGADDGVDENINVGDCMVVDVLSEWVWGTETMDVCSVICEDNTVCEDNVVVVVVVADIIVDEDVKLPNSASASEDTPASAAVPIASAADSKLVTSASAAVNDIDEDARPLKNVSTCSDNASASTMVIRDDNSISISDGIGDSATFKFAFRA